MRRKYTLDQINDIILEDVEYFIEENTTDSGITVELLKNPTCDLDEYDYVIEAFDGMGNGLRVKKFSELIQFIREEFDKIKATHREERLICGYHQCERLAGDYFDVEAVKEGYRRENRYSSNIVDLIPEEYLLSWFNLGFKSELGRYFYHAYLDLNIDRKWVLELLDKVSDKKSLRDNYYFGIPNTNEGVY